MVGPCTILKEYFNNPSFIKTAPFHHFRPICQYSFFLSAIFFASFSLNPIRFQKTMHRPVAKRPYMKKARQFTLTSFWDSDGISKGIRTPVAGMKTRCPRPLDDGDAALLFQAVHII